MLQCSMFLQGSGLEQVAANFLPKMENCDENHGVPGQDGVQAYSLAGGTHRDQD